MATKKEIHESAMAICANYKAPKALTKALDELLKPGKGGASVNVEDVYVPKAKDGKAYLQCSVSGLWMEATAENFYEDDSENNKFGGLKRLSRAAESARKKFINAKKATEKAVLTDLLAKKITEDEGNKQLAKFVAPDFSQIKGLKEKPAV
jgi:hypothetical protein